MDIFDKCRTFTRSKDIKDRGVYPYFTPLSTSEGPEVKVGDKSLIMMGSNNYLGLADHPRMKEASRKAVERWGTGCAGSRFLNGTLDLHVETEAKLAKFKHREAALIFATGYQMNLGVISALVGRHDTVIVDKWDHASIMDGARLAWGETVRYRHNDMDHLEEILQSVPDKRGKLIVVDGVFSMEGNICNLPEIVRLGKKYGARIILDDAHSTGVLGANGRGTSEHFNLDVSDIDLIVGTCSKSFGSVGGFVTGAKDVLHFIEIHARSMMFSAALPPASVAAISTALDMIQEEPERRVQLWKNAERLKSGLESVGFDTGVTETPIIPVLVGDDMQAFDFWHKIFEAGVFANPVVTPAVAPGRALMRNTLMATHTDEQIDRVLNIFEDCGKKVGLLPRSSGVSVGS
jgi:8-amino-7-oxononanoate synthase